MNVTENNPETRLTDLRNLLNKTQVEFANDLGVTQSALSQIENGNRKISTEKLVKITEMYGINANWLLNGLGTVFHTRKVAATPIHDQSDENFVPLIDQKAHADYPKNLNNDEYIKSFRMYRIPGYEDGNFRMFEVVGDSMEPTLYEKEIIISEYVSNIKKAGDGKIFIVISEDGIVVKRLFVYLQEVNHFILKSDNPRYKSYKVSQKDILEIWEVKGKITNQFLTLPPEDQRFIYLEERIAKLESEILKFKSKKH